MEKATAGRAGVRRQGRSRPCALVLVGCGAWLSAAGQVPAAAAPGRAEASLQMELQASAPPRLASGDTGLQAPRLDLLLRASGRGGLGLAIGMSGVAARTVPAPGYAPLRGGMDVGLHWRHTLRNDDQIDVTAWRRMAPAPDAYTLIQQRQPVYGARVEMKLTPVRKAGLTLERGIGFQLESGAKISIKRRHGGPMVYYRTAF